MSRNIEKQEAHQREEAAERDHPHAHLHHSPVTILLWSICVLFVLTAIFGGIGALTAPTTPGNSTADGVIGLLVILVAGLACGYFAWRRRLIPRDTAGRLASYPLSAPPRRYRGRRRAADPRANAIIFAIMFVICAAVVPFALSGEERSAYTQGHGIAASAVVVSSANNTSCGRSSCSTTFTALVDLTPPVNGQAQTTVHGQGDFGYDDGDQIPILIDPHARSYAELPGNRLDGSGGWVGFAGAALLLAVLFVVSLFRALRHHPARLPSRHTSSPDRGIKLV